MIAEVVLVFINVLTVAIIARIILSWVVLLAPSMRWLLYHPIGQAIDAITDPILAPIRSVMPSFGMIDLSPMIAIIVLQLIGQAVANAV